VSDSSTLRAQETERRALVGIACALVMLHALLTSLATIWSLPRSAADPAFAICHTGGAAGDTGTPEPAPATVLCGLCAHALAGMALPAAAGMLGPREPAALAVHHGVLTSIRVAAVPVRDGASRAPPAMT
jgi:hypothetical protein